MAKQLMDKCKTIAQLSDLLWIYIYIEFTILGIKSVLKSCLRSENRSKTFKVEVLNELSVASG